MQRLYRTIVQLEESKRFIIDGDVAHLRLALILLDNAVEAMMMRVIDDKLRNARLCARLLETFPAGPLDVEGEALRQDLRAKVIQPRRQKKIERYFGEKLRFLSEHCRCLPLPAARALGQLHKYRNEIQHRDRIRVGSIRPAVLVLFDIAADLLVNLRQGATVWASDEDRGCLRRYGFSDTSAVEIDELRARIATELRSGLPLDIVGIRAALVTHLTDRLEEMNDQLVFVATNGTIGPDPSHTLKAIQFWHLRQPVSHVEDDLEFQAFVPPHNLDSFAKWRSDVEKLNSLEDRLSMFGQFATIEDEFEPLEMLIEDVASAIDAQIQFEIDRRRGK